MENLTNETFKEKIFDYTTATEWSFKGNKPVIIDFYADWCQPCKIVAPLLEELEKEYEGKIDIYKINTEEELELATIYGIKSIPSLLFIPLTEQPKMAHGALPKDVFERIIKEEFNIEKNGEETTD